MTDYGTYSFANKTRSARDIAEVISNRLQEVDQQNRYYAQGASPNTTLMDLRIVGAKVYSIPSGWRGLFAKRKTVVTVFRLIDSAEGINIRLEDETKESDLKTIIERIKNES